MIAAGTNAPSRSVPARILVVDDHPYARESIAETLTRAGHAVRTAGDGRDALQRVREERFHLIVTDLKMNGLDGLGLIRALRKDGVDTQVVVITAHATVGSAVEAMRCGAYDYVEKPFDADRLEQVVAKALERGQLLEENRRLRDRLSERSPQEMVGRSAAMEKLRQRMAQVAASSATVLIQGESGTGKELVARGIHEISDRCAGPFVRLNCPVLSASLMESELFGHEKGAFTGAEEARAGRFELADGGSLLLDEVSEINLSLQAKLLRVLQEKEFERVGSSDTRCVDVRVIATTNRELRECVAQGEFREDLYFRLNVVPIVVPPLRDRREDIPQLAEHFLNRFADRHRQSPRRLARETLDLLFEYDWPGNVRELENLVERACVLDQGSVLQPDHVRPWLVDFAQEETGNLDGFTLREMERKLIEDTLQKYGGHRAQTAKALGIGVRTLTGKLRAYGYPPRASAPEGG